MSGRHARNKGHNFERFIARCFRAIGFKDAQRQLEYQANTVHGVDLSGTGIFKIQCKKRKLYSTINTIKEVKLKNPDTEIPVLITAADAMPPMAVLPLDCFLMLIDNAHMGTATLKEIRAKLRVAKGLNW